MSLDKEFEELLEKVRALPSMTEEQRWEQKIDFVYGNLSIDKAEAIDRPEFEANAWKFAWRKSQDRILQLRASLEAIVVADRDLASEIAESALRVDDSKLR
jgi:hypothetical protein